MKGGNHCLQLALRYRRAFWQIRGDETRNLVKGASELRSTIAEATLGAPSRFVERGVRFVQLIYSTWDHHTELETGLEKQCLATDRPAAALVADLKQRGLLDSALVVRGGEFGRTPWWRIGRPARTPAAGGPPPAGFQQVVERRRHPRGPDCRTHGRPWARSRRKPGRRE